MIEQQGQSLKFEAFFTATKVGKTGLTVTIDIRNPAGTLVVTAGSATEIGGGFYSYTLSSGSVSTAGNYRAVFKTTDTTVDQQHVPSLWTVGEAWVTNIDAAISSRNATAPDNTSIGTILTRTDVATSTRANATDYTTARAAKLDNLDVAVSTRNSTTPPTVAAIRSEMDTNSTRLAHLDVDVSTRNAVTPLTTVQTGAAVLDATTASHATAGTIGAAIGTAGSASDPLLNAVPGSYASGTAGAALGRIGAATVTVVSPVASTGTLTLEPGDDYASEEARTIDIVNAEGTWVNLTGATPSIYVYRQTWLIFSVAGTVVTATGANQLVRFVLTASNTGKLSRGDSNCNYSVKAVMSNGHIVTLAEDRVVVS